MQQIYLKHYFVFLHAHWGKGDQRWIKGHIGLLEAKDSENPTGNPQNETEQCGCHRQYDQLHMDNTNWMELR